MSVCSACGRKIRASTAVRRVASVDVFPCGVIVLSVQPGAVFNGRGQRVDGQAKDGQTGRLVWRLAVVDARCADPAQWANGFRDSPEVRVSVVSNREPATPRPDAVMEFAELYAVPYFDAGRCNGRGSSCRTQVKYALRATSIRSFKG